MVTRTVPKGTMPPTHYMGDAEASVHYAPSIGEGMVRGARLRSNTAHVVQTAGTFGIHSRISGPPRGEAPAVTPCHKQPA